MICARQGLLWLCLVATFARPGWAAEAQTPTPELVHIENQQLRLGVDAASGVLCELTAKADGDNRLVASPPSFSLWELVVQVDGKPITLASAQAGRPQIERLPEPAVGLRMTWPQVAFTGRSPLRVEAEVRLDEQGSRWNLAVGKPRDVGLEEIRFPRVGGIKPREREKLAIPFLMGRTMDEPRKHVLNPRRKNPRLVWRYPFRLTMQCVACYEPGGPGFGFACDDPVAYPKAFSLWCEPQGQVCCDVIHTPKGAAADVAEFRVPYAVVLHAFRGDWSDAAAWYRALPGPRAFATQSRFSRGETPDWVQQTGLWVWNRGRSEDVLTPAVELQKHVQVPVSVLWHWWHNCPYDAGFPEYFPPREGAAKFETALQAAQRQGIHAILYMNQRLWGTRTESWRREQAERYAVKGANGQVRTEVYNKYMQAPCAPMCIATDFWRNKYAGLAQEALCKLKADGVYMDQTGVGAACYDSHHGHVVGPGRYWFTGLDALTAQIRRQCAGCGPFALGGEYAVEPVMDNLDMMLSLNVSSDRLGLNAPWSVIPFVQAVYHPSTITFGNVAGLVYPPYDERWPADKAPDNCLQLLDAKFNKQFCLEQARTFVWGIQPMIANFRPELFAQRRAEIDFLTRMVRTRQRALKYLLHGVWLRPPALDVPSAEIDVAAVGTYAALAASKRTYPVALAGAWRAPDGEVGIPLASIQDEPLHLKLSLDFPRYGLGQRCTVYRSDETGRQRLGEVEAARPVFELDLPPRGLCVLELCRAE